MLIPGIRDLLLAILLMPVSALSYSQVFDEDFSDESSGATSGTSVGGTWTTIAPAGGGVSFSRQNVGGPYGGILMINDTGTEGMWQSSVLDISSLGEVALEVLMGGNNATASDYVRAYYIIDGGPEVMFAEVFGTAGTVVFTASSAAVSGSTLQIVIRGMDNSGGIMGFDDVLVTDIGVLYSIASTAWNNGSTWSTSGFTGIACGCTPNADRRVVIGNGRNVSFTADGTAAGVEIQNTGALTWTADGLDLNVTRGGAVNIQNGGMLDRAATNTSTIQFLNYTYNITVAGTLHIGALVFTSSGNSTINNSGTITLATPVGLTISAGGSGYVINNSGTINLQNLDVNTSDITVNNSGTINQTGSFTDVDAESTFNNLSGGVWNFGGTTTAGVRLFANNNSNTFNYNGGAQSIITPQDAYSNITLSGSGAKTQAASFAVNGNWARAGTATYAPGANRVTFSGTIPQTISSTGTETFANLTINNSSATGPQITLSCPVTVSANLTMTDGNVNLNGNVFTLSSNSPTALTHTQDPAAGWMYGGSLTRNFGTGNVAVGGVAGYYPLGSSVNSRPFLISKNSATSSNGSITVTYTDASTATDVNFLDGATTILRRHDSFWTLTKTGVTAGSFQIALGGTGFTIGAVNETRLTRASDVIGTMVASSGSATDIRVHRSGLTSAQLLNSFYIASTNASSTPLPIELAYFRARVEDDQVIATWKTEQEKDNHFFTIEKTADFEVIYEVGRLPGRGTTKEANTYSFVDQAPLPGRSYYRLKQTDFDGKFTTSDPVVVEYDGPAYPFIKVFPNPTQGGCLTVEVKGVRGLKAVPVQIYDQQGRRIVDIMIPEQPPGVFTTEINLGQDLSPGMYYLRAGRTLQLTERVIVR